jgi:hypothetical protein
VLDASDCCYEDDLQQPSNPVVHVLDCRGFTATGRWTISAAQKEALLQCCCHTASMRGPVLARLGWPWWQQLTLGQVRPAQLDGRWTVASHVSHAQSLT